MNLILLICIIIGTGSGLFAQEVTSAPQPSVSYHEPAEEDGFRDNDSNQIERDNHSSDIRNRAGMHHRKAFQTEDRRIAVSNLLTALELWRSIGEQDRIGSVLADLGELARADQDYHTALKYLMEAEQAFSSIRDDAGLAHVWNRQAAVYFEMGETDDAIIDKSLSLAHASLTIAQDLSIDNLTFNNLNIIGAAETRKTRYDEALISLNESLKILEKHGWIEVKPNILNNIAKVHFATGRWDDAIHTATISLKMAQETGVEPFIIEAAEILSQTYSRQGKYKEAFENLEILAAARNEFYYLDREKLVQDLHLQYETSRKEHAIEIEQRRRKEMTLTLSMLLFAILLIMTIIIGLILRRKNREIRVKNLTISEQLSHLKQVCDEKDHYFYRFNIAASSVDMGIWEMDLSDNRFEWDSRMYQLFGATEKAGTDPWPLLTKVVFPDDWIMLNNAIKSAVQDEGMLNVVFRINTESGKMKWLEAHAVIIKPDPPAQPKIIGAVRDVTQAKTIERETLENYSRMHFDQRMESLGQMAGGIAHDFNNLLTVIAGNLDILQQTLSPTGRGFSNLQAAISAAQRAETLTQKMLDYSGKTRSIVNVIDLSETVQTGLSCLNRTVPGQVSLTLDLAPALPAIQADQDQLHQVLSNLITNALEAVKSTEGVIRVATGSALYNADSLNESRTHAKPVPGNYVWLSVTDNGCGMDANTKQKMFDPFFSTKFAGRGLGLASVLGIVRGHRGAIFVDSELNEGTRITVLFPAWKSSGSHETDLSGSQSLRQDPVDLSAHSRYDS